MVAMARPMEPRPIQPMRGEVGVGVAMLDSIEGWSGRCYMGGKCMYICMGSGFSESGARVEWAGGWVAVERRIAEVQRSHGGSRGCEPVMMLDSVALWTEDVGDGHMQQD